MTVASYERDPAKPGECLFPVVPKNHRINTTGNHYLHAPRNNAHTDKPHVTKRSTETP